MDNEDKVVYSIAAVILTVVAVCTVVDTIKILKEGREERAKIKADSAKYIASLSRASEKINQDIKDGKYVHKPFTQVLNDLDFYTIVYNDL